MKKKSDKPACQRCNKQRELFRMYPKCQCKIFLCGDCRKNHWIWLQELSKQHIESKDINCFSNQNVGGVKNNISFVKLVEAYVLLLSGPDGKLTMAKTKDVPPDPRSDDVDSFVGSCPVNPRPKNKNFSYNPYIRKNNLLHLLHNPFYKP